MSYSADIEDAIKQCTNIERAISDLLEEVVGTEGTERSRMIQDIMSKISKAKDYASTIEMELYDITDTEANEEYRSKYELHMKSIAQLEEQAKIVSRKKEEAQKPLTTSDLQAASLNLQQQQKDSLSRSLSTAEQVKESGARTLEEIQRQEQQLEKADGHLDEMDSELNRAKKVMKVIMTRAAGDNCVRVLALLVLLAVLAVIIVEAVKPGAVKKQVDGWFSPEDGETPEAPETPASASKLMNFFTQWLLPKGQNKRPKSGKK